MDLADIKKNAKTAPSLSGNETFEQLLQILGKVMTDSVEEPYHKIFVNVDFADEDEANRGEVRPVTTALFRYRRSEGDAEKSFVVNNVNEVFKSIRKHLQSSGKGEVGGFTFTVGADKKFNLQVKYDDN
jgi:hypothetical protein